MTLLLSSAYFALLAAPHGASYATLFPTDLPPRDWVHFRADGFSEPACGVIYRKADTVTNGLALGGIDTGCIDLETSGLWGYSTIFNSHVPRRGPINLPFLGMSVGGQTWVLCDPSQMKQGWGEFQTKVGSTVLPPVWADLKLDGVRVPREIHYWGHYPVADIEFDTDAPVSVGVRAWTPFLPGDVPNSMIPGIIFEVHLRNTTDTTQNGALVFTFPGPTAAEAGSNRFTRTAIREACSGIQVSSPLSSYCVGVLGRGKTRVGGGLGANSAAWAAVNTTLPPQSSSDPSASVAVDFSLGARKTKVVRYFLTWCSPEWNNLGLPGKETMGQGDAASVRTFTHMYAKHYPSPETTAQMLAKNHASLLKRILAWQQVIYTDNKLPIWLRDSLVNVLYMITEDGLWAQAKAPLPDWVRPEDGLYGLIECPRGCPQIECIPCSFYGSLPMSYFFPQLELSTLRGYKGYQFEDGTPTWVFGARTDLSSPTKGYQFATNGISLAALVNEFVLCNDTADKALLREFYPMIKRCMIWTANLRTTPEYTVGERLISMPDGNKGSEWFEAAEPGWSGMAAHVGGLHIAQLRITRRMAREMGDTEFVKQCEDWTAAAQEAMEKRLWTGSYYLNFFEPETNIKSEFVFGYQLDGEWITDHHGLPGTLPKERVGTVLDTITRCNVALTKYGAVNYANPDATPIRPAKAGTWDYGQYSYFPPEALMLAMTYMYNGKPAFGLELARRVWHNLVCQQGYTWDMPNIMRGDRDTGERTFGNDYYQDMMLWSMPAALEGKDLSDTTKPGGLVNRVVAAAIGKR
ncbi:MAG: hypothetical protein HZB26_21130 [Candidatus Hydrogenedentes bacterium]|nr:hypothetical protein [Candidatus Hydrogenedentota bacterium]